MDYKTRIFFSNYHARYSVPLGYHVFGIHARLNNFITWQGDEERILREILDAAEVAQKAEAEQQAADVTYRREW